MNLNNLLCFIFVVVGVCSEQIPLSQDTLNNVFGPPQAYAQAVQAQAVTPPNGTLVDLDYWDSMDDFQQTTADYDKFDWTLTKRVAATSQDNFLLSPLGLKLALAILTEAATGPTKSELVSVLDFDLDRKTARRKFSAILESLHTKSSHYILNLGSRIYIEDTTRPRQQFAAISQVYYRTNLTGTDFSKPAQAASDINTWVSNITEGRIEKLVTEDEVAGMVVMILNTLFFKGTWRHQFLPNATAPGPFYITPKSLKTTAFMHIRDRFYYVDSVKLNAKILRMPYLGNKFSMYVVVPNSLTGLPQVLSGLADLRAELNQLREQLVDVTMPRFTFEYSSMLDGILKEMGIRQAFEDTASFPGIASGQLLSQRLHVTRVMQRSGIELNELGSLAYSATEISLVNKFGEGNEEPQEVVANKPFLFFIQDEGTRQLLFTGRVSDPSVGGGLLKKA